jgi:hypothetical protein
VQYAVPVGKTTRTTWRANVLEITQALNIPVGPGQWVRLESADDDSELSGDWVDIVRWESHPPATYQHELAGGTDD